MKSIFWEIKIVIIAAKKLKKRLTTNNSPLTINKSVHFHGKLLMWQQKTFTFTLMTGELRLWA